MDFLGSSDSSDNESPGLSKNSARRKDEDKLQVNKKFAEKFESQRRRQDLQSLKGVDLESGDGSGSDSESETEDEDAEMLTPALDVQIMKTINMIRSKDPGIYDTGKEWFATGDGGDSDDDADDATRAKKTEKPKRYKDVLREQIMSAETAQDAISSDESDGEAGGSAAGPRGRGLAYDEEQRKLREGLLGSIAKHEADGGDSSDDDEDGDDGDELLKVRIKTDAELAKEEEELRLEAEKMVAAGDGGEDDAFLKDFVANRRWLDPAAKKALPSYDEVVAGSDVGDSEDGEDLDRADEFESKYNFRFEEEGGREIALHARNVEGSMRRKDDKRKRIRESRKVRKAEERSQKEAELRRLKNLKREEIRKRLQKIQEMSGGALVGAEGIDLAGGGSQGGGNGNISGRGASASEAEALVDGEFDADKWDAVTGTAFGDEYYEAEDADNGWKPGDDPLEGLGDLDQYDDNAGDEAGEGWEGGDGENGDASEGYGDWGGEEGKGEGGLEEEEEEEEEGDGYGGVGVEKERLLDELYKLDYEDIIGDIPCRFKYTRVKANDFGLSPEEILLADDKELNKYVPLKKLAPYHREDPKLDARRRRQLRDEVRAREAAAEEEMLVLKKSKRRGRRKKIAAGKEAPAENGSAEPDEGAAANAPELVEVETAAGAASEVGDQLAGGKRRRRKKGQKKKRDQAAAMDGVLDGESEAALVPRVVPVAAPDRDGKREVDTTATDATSLKGKKRARQSNGASAGHEELDVELGEKINGKAGSDEAEVAGVDADGEGGEQSKKRTRRGRGGKGGRGRDGGKDDDGGKHGAKAGDRKTKKLALATGVSKSRLASYGL